MKTTITLYREHGDWRWTLHDARSGKIIGASSEAYVRRAACRKNLLRVTGVFLLDDRDGREVTVKLRDRAWWHA